MRRQFRFNNFLNSHVSNAIPAVRVCGVDEAASPSPSSPSTRFSSCLPCFAPCAACFTLFGVDFFDRWKSMPDRFSLSCFSGTTLGLVTWNDVSRYIEIGLIMIGFQQTFQSILYCTVGHHVVIKALMKVC